MSERMTAAEFRKLQGGSAPKRSKYGNKRHEVDGITFDSIKEARRYVDLKNMQASGQIEDLRIQHEFPIMVSDELICTYRSDFSYRHRGRTELVVEDVKSAPTRRKDSYILKKKLMKAVHGIEIQEI